MNYCRQSGSDNNRVNYSYNFTVFLKDGIYRNNQGATMPDL